MSADKERRVIDQIHERSYEETLMILELMPYRACYPILKLVYSAASNASYNMGSSETNLVISKDEVNGDIRVRVVSWYTASTSGLKGMRRGTPFAAQTIAANTIHTVVDQGHADTIGIAMRRALLGEIEGTCITRVKSEKVPHEYFTITGIPESVHEILMNLKEIVLRSNLYGTSDASICVKGTGYVTAKDIILPPYVETVDNTQHIASLTEPIDFFIGLQIERNYGYLIKTPHNFQDRSYPIDVVSMPVRNENHSIHSYGNGNEKQEILFIEIWTNKSLTPKEALH
ncbi:DNA-directed RNA polymerase subunit alpha [Capsicum baccatum]|uniref:DNA-directed RNA polymerase n=1 Tax=Capsicum baccatum TaxID=33114 RepID=A0A2G2VNG5_CAPBA|nr:DNA-directed RNA polymerase subunit alpha [Capsicum baccatum]